MERPPIRFARSGDARIAYFEAGDGPPDLVVVGGPASHLDLQWEEPSTARAFERLASFAHLVQFDRRGTGLSDPVTGELTLERQMEDLEAVIDAVGLPRPALMGSIEAGASAMYAATYPDRVTALVLADVPPAGGVVLDKELGDQRRKAFLDLVDEHWGEGRFLPLYAPSRIGDRRFEEWWARFERSCLTPAMARQIIDLNAQTDLRCVLSTIRVPTLVLHLTDNPLIPADATRELAALIPGARFEELPGTDLYMWPGSDSAACDRVEEFLTGRLRPHEPDRVLATVMFTDIVDSTGRAAKAGDRAWRELLDRHNELIRGELEHWHGREVKTLGDGFVATFDGPARGVRCAEAILYELSHLEIEARAGLHTGECEMLDGDVSGLAVHIGARIVDIAQGGEVLVSSTVKDLVVGSGLDFRERGSYSLRGVPDEWRLYSLRGTPT